MRWGFYPGVLRGSDRSPCVPGYTPPILADTDLDRIAGARAHVGPDIINEDQLHDVVRHVKTIRDEWRRAAAAGR
jgi:hypothetical protein